MAREARTDRLLLLLLAIAFLSFAAVGLSGASLVEEFGAKVARLKSSSEQERAGELQTAKHTVYRLQVE